MIDPEEILAWDRVDPYYVWAEVTEYAGMPLQNDKWVPLLVETASQTQTAQLMEDLIDAFRGQLSVPWTDRDVQRFTIHVEKNVLAGVLVMLKRQSVRWELSLPFGSPNVRTAFNGTNFRPESTKQIVGFIDYGCAFAHRQFRVWENGKRTLKTRLLALWDQGGDSLTNRRAAIKAGLRPPCWEPPGDFGYGAELKRDVDGFAGPWEVFESTPGHSATVKGLPINAYLQSFVRNGSIDEAACYAYAGYEAIQTPVTHGTHMMDVAAGYPNPLLQPDVNPGPAPAQEIVFVQLPRFFSGQQVSGLLRTYVLDAVHYILSCAEKTVPVTINLSYGAYAGPHDGSSILEMALDEVITKRRLEGGPTDIVIAAGNGGDAQAHASETLPGGEDISLNWRNIPDNPTDQFTEIWFGEEQPSTPCEIRFTLPGMIPDDQAWIKPGQCHHLLRNGEFVAMVIAPKQVCQSIRGRMVLFAVAPTIKSKGRAAAPYGNWVVEIRNPGASPVAIDAWIERDDPVFLSGSGPRQARFQRSDAKSSGTLNSIAHGSETIVVGGYVGGALRKPAYSSSGPGRGDQSMRNPSRAVGEQLQGPEWLAVCEESDALPGIAAAAVMVNERVRLPGTSVAAAVATRYVVGLHATSSQLSKLAAPPTTTISSDSSDQSEIEISIPCVPMP